MFKHTDKWQHKFVSWDELQWSQISLGISGSNPSGSNKFVSIHDPRLGDPKDAQVTKRIDIRKESALCCCQRDLYTCWWEFFLYIGKLIFFLFILYFSILLWYFSSFLFFYLKGTFFLVYLFYLVLLEFSSFFYIKCCDSFFAIKESSHQKLTLLNKTLKYDSYNFSITPSSASPLTHITLCLIFYQIKWEWWNLNSWLLSQQSSDIMSNNYLTQKFKLLGEIPRYDLYNSLILASGDMDEYKLNILIDSPYLQCSLFFRVLTYNKPFI